MGSYKSKNLKRDIESLPHLDPEPEYEIKTRSPKPGIWKLNLLRGKREDDLRNDAYPLARRKCYNKVKEFEKCEKENGKFWTSFNCQQEYEQMALCFDHEYLVEMDKLRRDMTRNTEWWWRCLYDEDGEIGEQAEWKGEWWLTLKLLNLKRKIYSKFFSS